VTEPSGVGTRNAPPFSFPFNSGITSPIALAAPVLEGVDVVVVPSVWYENAPLVIGTAQAFGIPVIATRLGGMKEMVLDEVNGFTFELGDPEDLADKIRLLAATPGLIADLSRNKILPPRIESEAFLLETLYSSLVGRSSW
jgi:glycosyltransferase involved in cell wall biosynthesis